MLIPFQKPLSKDWGIFVISKARELRMELGMMDKRLTKWPFFGIISRHCDYLSAGILILGKWGQS